MKYVCFLNEDTGQEEILVFPKTINHDCFAEMAGRIKNQIDGNWHRVMREPISAGFVAEIGAGLVCHGSSMTLGLSTRDCDTDILRKQLNR
jgi:hypothetical protein